jgi:hypothetical protein
MHTDNMKNFKNKTRRDTQIQLYKTFVPLYGSEIWAMTRKDKCKTETEEMCFLHSPDGVPLQNQNRSTDIRNELGTFNVHEISEECKKTWRIHLDNGGRMIDKKYVSV